MKFLKVTGRILKGLYDILAAYLLGWILFLALVAYGFHLGLDAAAHANDFPSIDAWWQGLATRHGQTLVLAGRLAIFGGLHIALVYVFRGPLGRVKVGLETVFDRLRDVFRHHTRNSSRAQTTGQILFSLALTLLLIPFVLQPTLVPRYTTVRSWAQRAANLADGTASRFVADSVVGLYRQIYARPVPATGGVSDEDVDDASPAGAASAPPSPTGNQPLMDRWDPKIRQFADGNPQTFAFIKAFMWVESAGRQFAVSTTGCSGLMQFCAPTARSRPYRQAFGTGRVYACQCDGQCRVDTQIRRGLETGELKPATISDQFPCKLSDARFDPTRSIRAGAMYVRRLASRFDDNIYLMYIGYNSGPAVAAAVFERLGQNGDATLADIKTHLVGALKPHYGPGSARRARSLLRTHLPKIKRAYDRYYTGVERASLGD